MQRTYQLSEIAPTRADTEMAALFRREGTQRHFASGAIIQQRGEETDGFWMVGAGNISVCRFGIDGNVTVYAVLGPGDVFGELAYFTNAARQVDVVAESDAVLLRINARSIERLLQTELNFSRWLLKSLSNQLRVALDRIAGDQLLSAEARIARALVEMVRREGPELQTTQEELANYVGVSRVTAGQILRQFAQAGIISLGYRRIAVLSIAELERTIPALTLGALSGDRSSAQRITQDRTNTAP